MKKLTILSACLLLLSGVTTAQASFIIDPNPGGSALNLLTMNGVKASSATIGLETVNITSTQFFDTASGAASIKPADNETLTSLTFTPVDNTAFNAFSFRGQLDITAFGTVFLHWVASDGLFGNLVFNGLGADADFARMGIYSIDGETLESVTLIASGNGFRSVQQVELNEAATSVPEPGSFALFGMGMVGLGGMVWRKRTKAKATV